jgi:hypothetical protein
MQGRMEREKISKNEILFNKFRIFFHFKENKTKIIHTLPPLLRHSLPQMQQEMKNAMARLLLLCFICKERSFCS